LEDFFVFKGFYMQQKFYFDYEVFDEISSLSESDATLLQAARKVTTSAYAPYSGFRVGAVAKLANGATVSGTNQENASYPIGICAERVLLSAASSLYPGIPIETMAISYFNEKGSSNKPVTPCGICRQSMTEYQTRFQQPIRLILSGQEGKILVIPSADQLLPLGFSVDDLQS
jgi:cytidine deaminase